MTSKEKVKFEAFTYDEEIIRILRSMKENSVAFECPRNHFHLVYPIEEYGFPQVTEKKQP